MAFPKLQNGRVDKQVTNVLLAYTNPEFIAPQILPTVPNLTEESGLIASLGNEHFRIYDSVRTLYDESEHRMEFKISNDKTYRIDYHDLELYLPDRLQKQIDLPFNVRRDGGITLMQAMMLEREYALASAMTSTSVLTNYTTLSGTSQLNDYTNSDPAGVIETARTSVQNKTGHEANSVVLSRKVFNTLKRHPFFLNLVRGVSVLTPSMLVQLMKDYFEFENVIIGKTIYSSAKEGQTESLTQLWGNDMVVFYRPSTASLLTPSFGYNFALSGENLRASVRRHTNDKGDILALDYAYQDKILDVNSAYLVKSAVA
jgi:hypothetical protein